MGNQVVQENRKRWSRAALILSTALALSAFLGWQTRLAAHDNDAKQKYLEEATKSPDRGNNAIPGAINLGLTSRRRSGSFAGAYLNKALKSRSYNSGSYGGNYQTSGKKHFGSDPREDVKLLAAAEGETVRPGASCPANVPKRVFNISAINVEITLNQYHDFYPGVMYVLDENIEKVRAEEKRNEEARENEHDPGALTQGLSGDAIQPLAIRVNQGECLVLKVSNKVEEEKVSFHLHGSSLLIQDSGKPAVAKNPESYIEEEKSQTYEWYVGLDQQEGVHQFHSHVRDQASTGLFGTVTVEPKGSRFLDPYSGKELKSGWLAMIEDPNGPDFREFVVVYHETGDEEFRPLKKNEEMIPLLDETAHNYRSSTRALNYRSEAFGNNLLLEKKLFGQLDESLAYSAYKNGDTVTPIPRSYLGDPAKWRLVHGGSEVFHSHHLHGGAIRWRRQAKLKQDLNLFGTNNFALASDGPVKFPPVRSASDRVDVQTIGPAETHDLVIECGTGGCQRGAGDFLYHCHIPQHYVAGMWAYWRSYNTLQVKGLSTDVMPPLAELPDRKGKMKPAVSSDRLIGRTVRQFGKNYKISVRGGDSKKGEYSLTNWVESQLPPKGLPGKKADPKEQTLANDASVWNWDKKKMSGGRMLYLGEPETKVKWPKYKPEWMGSKPGKRPKLMFDPATGRLAYPHMRPHFGRRPPFSPGHNGAPFLEPFHERADGSKSTDVPVPGENGPWSLCPAESDSPAQRKHYNVHAITTPITLAKEEGKLLPIVDKDGQIYVLHEEEEEIRANDDLKIPLVLRANVGDCVDVTLTNEIPDYEENLYSSKVNMHIHFVQFDTQASDGVITGMSYEQSVRPFTMLEADGKGMGKPQNEPITEAVKAGATQITLRSTDPYQVGVMVGVGMDAVGKLDIARITAIKGNTLVLERPLKYDHKAGQIVSTEFVRYRWYADADFGITYWHDHAFGLTSWGHGLFGATVIEPPHSTYHHPATGEPVRSGNIVDIRTTEPVSSQVRGSFREFVMQIQDSNPRTENRIMSGTVPEKRSSKDAKPKPINPLGSMDSWSLMPTALKYLNGGDRTTGSSIGLRVEPFNRRLANHKDASKLFSSRVHGDPDTPLLRAYLGDPIVLRTLDHAGNEMHTIQVQGHYFPLERYATGAKPANAVHLGIAERYDLVIPAAGGPQKMAGDYMYRSGRMSHFAEGMWGLIRVLDKRVDDLRPLPGREIVPKSAKAVCPKDAPVKKFQVSAIDYKMDLNPLAPDTIKPGSAGTNRLILASNPDGKIYVLDDEIKAVRAGKKRPHPLVLHVNIGDCLKIRFTNRMKTGEASFHADMLAYDPHSSMGANIGNNRGDQTESIGVPRHYTFYAHPEFGEATAMISDYGDVTKNVRNGLYGAIIVGPRGSEYFDVTSGDDVSKRNAWMVDVVVNDKLAENKGKTNYRDAALFFQDEDNVIGTAFMPYVRDSAGLTAVNYRIEPFAWRAKKYECEFEDGFLCEGAPDPVTPLITATAGDNLRIHVIGAHGEQNSTFSIENHQWPLEPDLEGAEMLEAQHFGGHETLQVHIKAGGPYGVPGDYVWLSHRLAYAEAGQWGLLRVLPRKKGKLASQGGGEKKKGGKKKVKAQKKGPEKVTLLKRPESPWSGEQQ